jgi:hypothetical protein
MNKNWKFKAGHTAIIEAEGNLLANNFPKQEFVCRWIEGTKTFLFAQKKDSGVDLWSFGQYDSWVLPSNLHAVFCGMIPEGTELVRPEPTKKARTFDKGYSP